MNEQKEMTARNTSVGADERQSPNVTNNSITEAGKKIKFFGVKCGDDND